MCSENRCCLHCLHPNLTSAYPKPTDTESDLQLGQALLSRPVFAARYMDVSTQQANSTPGFLSLSDHLLCHVFSYLGSKLQVLPLVCQRWNAVVSSSQSLLRYIFFNPAAQGIANVDANSCSFLTCLRPRGELFEVFDCEVYSCVATADVLGQLGRLRSLTIVVRDQLKALLPLFEAIGKLSILQHLDISSGGSWTANITPLQHLASLGELSLGRYGEPCIISTGLDALASGATCLTLLSLETAGYLDLVPLTALQELTCVHVSSTNSQPDIVSGLNYSCRA